MSQVWVNGERGASLSPWDRGLHYGDGVFETIALIHQTPLLWTRHMHRLALGCACLDIPMPDLTVLEAEAKQVMVQAGDRAVIKIMVTRGVGGRGYRFPSPAQSTRIIMLNAWPCYPARYWREGIDVRICTTRLARQPKLAGIKHLNRLEQVLARHEWQDEAISEGIMCDEQNHVIEGTMSNLFMRIQGRLVTPALDVCGVAGTLRAEILASTRAMGLSIEVATMTLEALRSADEVLVTNSVIGIWPVKRIADKCYVVGEMAKQLGNLVAAAGYDHRLYSVDP